MRKETEGQKQSKEGEVSRTFRSLRYANFRLYFFGQGVSLCGTWMQNLALSWLVWRLTKSAWLLGVVEFANLIPVLIFALGGGWVADRADRKKVLIGAQIMFMVQASVLATLTLTGHIQVWHIIALAALAGIISSFEIPSRQSLIVSLVDKEDLVNAISLNSSLFNGTRIIGPALAAGVIGLSGEGTCFLVNTLSYMAALAALILLKVPPANKEASTASGIQEGLRFAVRTPSVRSLLRLTAGLSLFGGQFSVLLPVMASNVLHSDVAGFGALRAMAAIGSFFAALTLARRGSFDMLNSSIGYAALGFGIMLMLFSLSGNFAASMCIVLFLGYCMTFQISGSHSFLQLTVPDEIRGRLMSVWVMIIMGMSPLGSLFVGWAASQWGAPLSLAVCAAVCCLSALIYLITGK